MLLGARTRHLCGRHQRNIFFALCLLSITLSTLLLFSPWPAHPDFGPKSLPELLAPKPFVPTVERLAPEPKSFAHGTVFLPCIGPRGTVVKEGKDVPHATYSLPNISYPRGTTGSYEAIGLEKSWLTADQRYGPYGYGEKHDSVDWTNVRWGRLQHECVLSNRGGLPGRLSSEFDTRPRFRFQADAPAQSPNIQTGRQAIVLRAWSTYKYQPEDFWNIRAIIAEASLATGGRFEVVLLVDVKDEEKGPRIHESDEIYREVLTASVPPEFQDITILFHHSLQSNWYPKVVEIRSFWQIMQPLQLFAHFYPEYDHFWQIELDTRFTGDVGKMLHAFHEFSTNEPYKQSRERASWAFMPEMHGSWEEFRQSINKAMKGGAGVWGPVTIKNFEPIAAPPPMKPEDDDFQYGVGVDADLLLFNSLEDVTKIERWEDWNFKDWYMGGFDKNVPRWVSTPAQARASWRLLEAIHQIQQELGLRIHSEATLPSFALWNGLKVVGLPIPRFQVPTRDPVELNKILNGKYPSAFPSGLAYGAGRYRASAVNFFLRHMTWAWWTKLPDHIYDHWFGLEVDVGEPQSKDAKKNKKPPSLEPVDVSLPPGLPFFMANVSGEIYAPSMMLHPRKTNTYRAPE